LKKNLSFAEPLSLRNNALRCVWIATEALVRLTFVEIMVESSAKITKVVFSECGMSDVNMLKNVEANILPWVICFKVEDLR